MKSRKKQGKRTLKKSMTTILKPSKLVSKNSPLIVERNDAEESDGEDTDRPLKAADSTVDFDEEKLMDEIIEESK
jgi:hypothetical protein